MLYEIQVQKVWVDIRDLITPSVASIKDFVSQYSKLSDDEFISAIHKCVAGHRYQVISTLYYPSQAISLMLKDKPLDCVPKSLIITSCLRTRNLNAYSVFGIYKYQNGREEHHAWCLLNDNCVLESTSYLVYPINNTLYSPEIQFNDSDVRILSPQSKMFR
jgi:hypothetical protein